MKECSTVWKEMMGENVTKTIFSGRDSVIT